MVGRPTSLLSWVNWKNIYVIFPQCIFLEPGPTCMALTSPNWKHLQHGQAMSPGQRWSPWWSMWLQDTHNAIVLMTINGHPERSHLWHWTSLNLEMLEMPGCQSETSVDNTGPTHHHGWDLITLRVLVCVYIYIHVLSCILRVCMHVCLYCNGM